MSFSPFPSVSLGPLPDPGGEISHIIVHRLALATHRLAPLGDLSLIGGTNGGIPRRDLYASQQGYRPAAVAHERRCHLESAAPPYCRGEVAEANRCHTHLHGLYRMLLVRQFDASIVEYPDGHLHWPIGECIGNIACYLVIRELTNQGDRRCRTDFLHCPCGAHGRYEDHGEYPDYCERQSLLSLHLFLLLVPRPLRSACACPWRSPDFLSSGCTSGSWCR